MSSSPSETASREVSRRRMPWAALIAVLVAFVLLPALLDAFIPGTEPSDEFPDQGSVTTLIAEQVVALLVAVVAVSMLRWWPVMLRESLRTRRWVWAIPVVSLAVSLVRVDYTRLASAGAGIALSLLVAALLIGASEELMFRGIVLRFMRDRYRETTAAIVTTLVFGLSHFPAGPLNIVAAAFTGYLLYYTRRVSGGLLLPIVVHAMYDFAVFSQTTTSNPSTDGTTGMIQFLVDLALVVAMIALYRLAEPRTVPETEVTAQQVT